jgi:elongation factor Ts
MRRNQVAEVTSELIKELREKTQVGILDCKKALVECDGDVEKAADFLRKKGLAKASKKMGRTASEGIISSYIHNNSKIGVLLELNCETDFVAKNADFQELSKELCMQIAATNPLYIDINDIPAEEIEREKEIYREQLKDSGKPENVLDKIIEGKLKKYYTEVCLLEQEYIKDSGVVIKDIVKSKIATYGENITVGRFTRYQIGR